MVPLTKKCFNSKKGLERIFGMCWNVLYRESKDYIRKYYTDPKNIAKQMFLIISQLLVI